MARHDLELDELVRTESDTKPKKPPLFRVLLHNDDFTTMDFVVYVLRTVFEMSDVEAVSVMLRVHVEGIGIAGVYPFEIAEAKAERTVALARENEFPLLCTVEEN